jgi:hypothetical protein
MTDFLLQQKEVISQQIDQTDLALRRAQDSGKQLEAQLNGLVGAFQTINQLIEKAQQEEKSEKNA